MNNENLSSFCQRRISKIVLPEMVEGIPLMV